MVSISIQHDTTKPYSTFEVVDDIIFRMKDVSTTGKVIQLELHGFSHVQAKAIINVLCYAYMASLNQVSVKTTFHPDNKDHATYDIDGVGSMEIDIKKSNTPSTASFPAHVQGTLPAYQMARIADHIKKALIRTEGTISYEDKGEYYVLPYRNPRTMHGIVSVFANILHAQLSIHDNDIGVCDGVINDIGEECSAILIRKEVLDELFKKERLKVGKSP